MSVDNEKFMSGLHECNSSFLIFEQTCSPVSRADRGSALQTEWNVWVGYWHRHSEQTSKVTSNPTLTWDTETEKLTMAVVPIGRTNYKPASRYRLYGCSGEVAPVQTRINGCALLYGQLTTNNDKKSTEFGQKLSISTLIRQARSRKSANRSPICSWSSETGLEIAPIIGRHTR